MARSGAEGLLKPTATRTKMTPKADTADASIENNHTFDMKTDLLAVRMSNTALARNAILLSRLSTQALQTTTPSVMTNCRESRSASNCQIVTGS